MSAVANHVGFHHFEDDIFAAHAGCHKRIHSAAHAELGIVNRRRHEIDEEAAVSILFGRAQNGEPARVRVKGVNLVPDLSSLDDFPAAIQPFRLQTDEAFMRHYLAAGRIHDGLKPRFELVADESLFKPVRLVYSPPLVEIAENRERLAPELAYAYRAPFRPGQHLPEKPNHPRVLSPAGDRVDISLPFKFNSQGIQRPLKQFAHVTGFGDQMESRT